MTTDALKGVCNMKQRKVDKANEELRKAVEDFLPTGKTVSVKRGNGVWRVEVQGYSVGDISPSEFRAKSQNGKSHWFDYSDVIISQ